MGSVLDIFSNVPLCSTVVHAVAGKGEMRFVKVEFLSYCLQNNSVRPVSV